MVLVNVGVKGNVKSNLVSVLILIFPGSDFIQCLRFVIYEMVRISRKIFAFRSVFEVNLPRY